MSEAIIKDKNKSLNQIIDLIQAELDNFDSRLLNEISPKSRSLCSILQDIFAAGGKRIRPVISFLIFRALHGEGFASDEQKEKLYQIAEISELIHTASLVHDDIIDNSLIRRGKPTTNSKWDNAVTVISGDFMFARAAVNLGRVGINEITSLYARVLEDLCDGEIWQVEKKFSAELDWDYYYEKTFKKTASLFEASALAPAILLELKEEQQKAISDYGTKLGMAFQLMDDILDFTSDTEKLGKPAFADLKEGQITLPVLLTIEKANKEELASIKNNLRTLSAPDTAEQANEAAKEIVALIEKYDAINLSFAKANEFIQEAVSSLSFIEDSNYKNALIELADFMVQRDS